MYTRHQSRPNSPPYRLGHPPLIHWAERSILAMFDPSHFGHVLGHDAEVLHCISKLD